MIHTEQLIQQNNTKRESLTDVNKQLYEDFLMYFRTDLRVSEHDAEELLMDILDHLLDAQSEGRSAHHLFGENPKEYADELIAQLPSENKKSRVVFIGSIFTNMLAYLVIIKGLVNFILPFFTEGKEALEVGNTLLVAFLMAITIPFAVKMIFSLIRGSLFTEDQKMSEKKMFVKAGLFGALLFSPVVLVMAFMPSFGPVIMIEWWIYVLVGVFLYISSKFIMKRT
ncbi:putative membrane-anchored protein [Alkalihalobacillus xiaoxiensis]|uniref:Membrane-anchored protein n=1 Tax=Shouchella xiaoxiensis TaxID=766895 RepID=A0ABS2SMQ1_9BACI|nr:DUF1129 family protein [Shouchella xiaoxiensis]MBM7836797.1 putative membrane-anchored protein [Shouchella xiaoxiensis]